MATMVTSTRPPATKKGAGTPPGFPGPNGNGSNRGGEFRDPESRANRYRIGMWVGLASVAMMFTSLSSAYIVRPASSNDSVALPAAEGVAGKRGVDSWQQRHDRDRPAQIESGVGRAIREVVVRHGVTRR